MGGSVIDLSLQLHKKHGKMGLKAINEDLFDVFGGVAGIHPWRNPENSEKQPCFLPFGKAENNASPVLSGVCGKVLQLHP